MSRRWGNNNITKQVKDYIIPLIFWVIIFGMFIKFFFWDTATQKPATTNTNSSVEVSINWETTKWQIVYNWGKTAELTQTKNIFQWEKIILQEWWDAKLTLPNTNWSINLKSKWELLYDWWDKFKFLSSELWADIAKSINIEMRYAKVSSTEAWVFSLSQNEVSSTIYVLSWNLTVSTLAWVSTILPAWKQIVIMRTDANNKELKIDEKITDIEDYIKTSDEWFKSNWWEVYLQQLIDSTKATETQEKNEAIDAWKKTWFIQFSNIADEWNATTTDFTIQWTITNDLVYRIVINGIDATINTETKTFEVTIKLPKKANDVVYKVFDWESNVLQKSLLTIYNASWEDEKKEISSVSSTNYDIKKDDRFTIIGPNPNPLTTTETNLRFEWWVPSGEVSRIVVNGFQLTKFVPNSTYWYYFANTTTWNLKDWLNIYKIEYYGADNKIIFENNIVVIKNPS